MFVYSLKNERIYGVRRGFIFCIYFFKNLIKPKQIALAYPREY